MRSAFRVAQTLSLACGLLLSAGCLLDRLYETRHQLCSGEFQTQIMDGVRITLRHPTLSDRDVICIVGVAPQETVSPDIKIITYVAKRRSDMASSVDQIPITLKFVMLDGVYKLQEGHIDKNLAAIVSAPLIVQGIKSACTAKLSLVRRSIEVPLEIDRELLPSRTAVIEALGTPDSEDAATRSLIYEYAVASDMRHIARIAAYFDPSWSEIQRVDVSYLGHRFNADLSERRAVVTGGGNWGCAFRL